MNPEEKYFQSLCMYINFILSSFSYVILSTVALLEISPPQRVLINPDDVQEDTVVVNWQPPQETSLVCIEVKPITNSSELVSYFVHDNNSFAIESLVPGMTYEIGLSAVINGNRSERIAIQQTLRMYFLAVVSLNVMIR